MNNRLLHLGLFEGVGGFGLAAKWNGIETIATCDINEFGNKVTAHHFPEAYKHGDVRTLTKEILDDNLFQDMTQIGQVERSSQQGSPASHSLSLEEEQERMMTATSGRRLSELLRRSDPLGLLAKMLLESSRWYSPLASLKWQAEQMRSERYTTRIRSAASSSQSESVKTLRVSDIPSSRLLYRLVPSARHTEEIEFGLLPTPRAKDGSHGGQIVEGKKITRPSGQTFSASLGDMGKSNLLPTPQTQGLKVCNAKGKTELLNLEMLPTPRTSGEENYETRAERKGHRTAMSYLQENIQFQTGSTSQLSPLFVAEMMGFPLNWLVSPFQSGDGNL